MRLCSLCGLQLSSDQVEAGICYFHVFHHHDDWAASNKILCDFFHRGIAPERVERGNSSIVDPDVIGV